MSETPAPITTTRELAQWISDRLAERPDVEQSRIINADMDIPDVGVEIQHPNGGTVEFFVSVEDA